MSIYINEHGIYNLLLQSKMIKAQNVAKWITTNLVSI